MVHSGRDPIDSIQVLLTAEEAYPAFERLFLDAEDQIDASFRVFDLDTKLRSAEAQRIGTTWFDLFEHTLSRGVRINFVISDFDPVIATNYHRKSWESAQQLAGAAALASVGQLSFRIAQHPARAGLIPRLLLKRRVREKFLASKPDQHTPGLNDIDENDLFDLSPVTHHQKMAVFDQKTLYIGGLDLDERRYDTKNHARDAADTWQDVQAIVTGDVVNAALAHLTSFENVVAGKEPPAPRAPGFLRTISKRRWPAPLHISPKTVVNEIEEAHCDAAKNARDLIYLETQYLRHLPFASKLAKAATCSSGLRLFVVLPAAPEDIAFEGNTGRDARMGEHLQAEAITMLQDAFQERVMFCSPVGRRAAPDTSQRDTLHNSPIVYVHSKVSIFDNATAIVSSANLNGRSLRWDTEAGIQLTSAHHVKALRERMFAHWFPDHDTSNAILAQSFDSFAATVMDDAARRPEHRQSRLLPYDLDAAESLAKPVPYVPNELV